MVFQGGLRLISRILPDYCSIAMHCVQVDKYVGRSADKEKFNDLLNTFFTLKGILQVFLEIFNLPLLFCTDGSYQKPAISN